MKQRSSRILTGFLFSVLFVALCAYGYLRWGEYLVASSGLDREWARAQKNGLPLTADDLKPKPAIEPSQNAAVELVALANQVNLASKKPKQTGVGYELALTEPFLDAVAKACEKPRYWAERDYDEGLDLLLPEFAGFKMIGKGLAFRARERARQGDFSGALSDIQTGYRLSHLLTNEPCLLGQLVAMAIYSIQTAALDEIADCAFGDAALLRKIRVKILEPSQPPSDLRPALRGEMYFGVSTARNLDRYGGAKGLAESTKLSSEGQSDFVVNRKIPLERTGMPKGSVNRAYLTRNLEFWNRVVESEAWKSGDNPQLITLLDHWSKAFPRRPSYLLNVILVPSFSALPVALSRVEAYKRTRRSLLLVLEYQAKHKAFPTSLAAAGADADDPFLKGERLRYAVEGNSVRVWSVGPNKKDDSASTDKKDDLVARYPYVKKR